MRIAPVFVLWLAACGGAPLPPSPTSQVALEATRASPDDAVVATANGKPVWGSCVATQAARHHRERAAALDECVAFELLAQEAARRGLDHAPEVVDAWRTALVSRFVEVAFEDASRTAGDLGETFDRFVDHNQWRSHRPEFRSSTYVRITVPDGSPPDVDARARAIADALAGQLANETGLFKRNLLEAAYKVANNAHVDIEPATDALPKVMKVIYDDRPPEHIARLDKRYGDALYAISEVGRISLPVRTRWGWDVILWTGGIAAREITRDQLSADLFPEFRRAYFVAWVDEIQRASKVAIERHPEILERSETGVGTPTAPPAGRGAVPPVGSRRSMAREIVYPKGMP
jgi:hypothetical protein